MSPVRICRHCLMLERLHTAAGIVYGTTCDNFEEEDDVPDTAPATEKQAVKTDD